MTIVQEPNADQVRAVVRALLATTGRAMGGFPDGRWLVESGLVRYSTGKPAPRLNGVAVLDGRADRGAAEAWLAELAARGYPSCLMTRPAAPEWAGALAEQFGLADAGTEPLMWHREPATVTAPPGGPTLIAAVDPRDGDTVRAAQRLFAEGFGAPEEILGPMLSAEVIAVEGSTTYVGTSEGVACVVGTASLVDGYLGVYNIATPPPHRRRGHGAAMTVHVVLDGVRHGAHTAYLQASTDGFAIYERLGFRTIEEWRTYYPVGEAEA